MSDLTVRRATEDDLPKLIEFVLAQVKEGEGAIKSEEVVSLGIRRALIDDSLAMYWVLVDEADIPVGCASVTREWSNWNAGYYWWMQSLYIGREQRGKGGMAMVIDAIKAEMIYQGGLELRLYVNKDNLPAKAAYERNNFYTSVYEVMVLADET